MTDRRQKPRDIPPQLNREIQRKMSQLSSDLEREIWAAYLGVDPKNLKRKGKKVRIKSRQDFEALFK